MDFNTKEQCLEELVRVFQESGGRPVSRDYFRNNSMCDEADWTKFFGTFTEFKRAASLVPTREEQRILSNIARHASTDRLRDLNKEKAGYEDAYLRDSNRRFQSLVVASDIHDLYADPFYLRVLADAVKRVQPERIVLNGDILDLAEFSRYTKDPREYKPVERIKWLHSFLRELREASPDSQIDYIEGNHENRIMRHLADSSPQLVSILSDLLGFTVADIFGLKDFEVNFISRTDLATFSERDIKNELAKNYLIVNGQLLFHHFPYGQHMGFPGASGHHHKHLVFNRYSPVFGSYEWHQTGCGHFRRAAYTEGEKWSVGFLIVHMDTQNKRSQFEYIDCTNHHCMMGGKLYQRDDVEQGFWC